MTNVITNIHYLKCNGYCITYLLFLSQTMNLNAWIFKSLNLKKKQTNSETQRLHNRRLDYRPKSSEFQGYENEQTHSLCRQQPWKVALYYRCRYIAPTYRALICRSYTVYIIGYWHHHVVRLSVCDAVHCGSQDRCTGLKVVPAGS